MNNIINYSISKKLYLKNGLFYYLNFVKINERIRLLQNLSYSKKKRLYPYYIILRHLYQFRCAILYNRKKSERID